MVGAEPQKINEIEMRDTQGGGDEGATPVRDIHLQI